MKRLFHNHFGALLAWIVIVVAAIAMLPNVNALTRAHSNITLPSNVQSEVANTMGNHWGHHDNHTYEVAGVFNNGNQKLSAAQTHRVKKTIKYIRNHKSKYGVTSITSAYDNAATRKQLISKDKTTVLVQMNVKNNFKTVAKVNTMLSSAMKTKGLKTYVTGSKILTDDFSAAVQEGIKKTETVSVIFIFIILILVFRSPIVPLISLLTVGVAFMTSFSLVTNLVQKFNFPFSNFTQVFMVIVLFGIGTDYNILLYNQFKENLGQGMKNWEAAQNARTKAGRTILMSGSTILIGFTALGLARFSVYRSAVGVAVGVAVLLVVLLTLNQFFMAVLGKKMFWPVKEFEAESHSRSWHWLSYHALKQPVLVLAIIAIIMVPFAFFANRPLSYDDTTEIANNVPSKQGYLVVTKHFSKGTAEPSTLYIKANHKLDNEKDLKLIDQVTSQMSRNKHVKLAASVTRPAGKKVSALYVNNQLGTLNQGLGQASSSLGTMASASPQLAMAMGTMTPQLSQGTSYLRDLQRSSAANTFYIPNRTLHSQQFKPAIKSYLSSDKKTAKITIVLKNNPNRYEASDQSAELRTIAASSLKGTDLNGASVAMGGQAQRIKDVRTVSTGDFLRTAAIMVVGITIALIFVTQSLLQPVYIMTTLVLSFMTSLSINHWLVQAFLGRSMLTWNTPFFSMIMVIALGVDYSIFLMRRYREYYLETHTPNDNIFRASTNMGNVVMSAAIILSGTFAALIPSGIPTLIEVAMTVIVGLILLTIVLPEVMSATVKLTYGRHDPVPDFSVHAHFGKKKQQSK